MHTLYETIRTIKKFYFVSGGKMSSGIRKIIRTIKQLTNHH